MSKAVKKLFIHAGLQKTGSTSLQHFFFMNRDFLKNNGVLYPASPNNSPLNPDVIGHHSDMLPTFYSHYSFNRLSPELTMQYYIDEILSSDCEVALLSTEDLFYNDPSLIRKLTDSFQVIFIVYLRYFPFYAESLQNQIFKSRGTALYFSSYPITPYTYVSDSAFANIENLKKFVNYFGYEHFVFKNFEKITQNKNLYEGILSDLGIEMTEEMLLPEKENISLKMPYLFFLAHSYTVALDFTTRFALENECLLLSNSDTTKYKFRLITEASLSSISNDKLECLDAINHFSGDPSFFTRGVEAFLSIPAYKSKQLNSEVQEEIFLRLSGYLQERIKSQYSPCREKCFCFPTIPNNMDEIGKLTYYFDAYNHKTFFDFSTVHNKLDGKTEKLFKQLREGKMDIPKISKSALDIIRAKFLELNQESSMCSVHYQEDILNYLCYNSDKGATIIEVGTYHGGFSVLLAYYARIYNKKMVFIDLSKENLDITQKNINRLIAMEGDFFCGTLEEYVANNKCENILAVIIDSDHRYHNCKSDCNALKKIEQNVHLAFFHDYSLRSIADEQSEKTSEWQKDLGVDRGIRDVFYDKKLFFIGDLNFTDIPTVNDSDYYFYGPEGCALFL